MATTADREHNIWFIVWPGVQVLDLAGPHEVFDGANKIADSLDRSGLRYRLRVAGPDGTEITSESGLRVGCDPLPGYRTGQALSATSIDTLFLPGGNGVHAASEDPELVAAVAGLGERAARVATVCTGTFLAAAAGLIDGKRVATHWARAERLANEHPIVDVDVDALHVRDGDVWSSAGVMAGVDLALALVEHDHDAEVAQIVARWLVVHLRRPGGQSQFAAPVWDQPSFVEPIRRAQERVQADPAALHTVSELAAAVGLSARHFSRLFTTEVGESPARYVDRVRVEAARRELETGNAGLNVVATRCGFGTAETMRRAFHRRLGVAPDEYRRRFQLT